MNFLKKTALTFFMAISLGAISTTVFAAEAAPDSAVSITETIGHVEQALVEVGKNDFSASVLHIKAARSSAESITGNEKILKQANANVVQGQIQAKLGDEKKSAAELTKALELYKSL
ncbi:MAG: hypothetical protein RLZZ419_652 [Pseudomonadota bacterium]|jgi:hypothetical protein